jgi:hypothetical protein
MCPFCFAIESELSEEPVRGGGLLEPRLLDGGFKTPHSCCSHYSAMERGHVSACDTTPASSARVLPLRAIRDELLARSGCGARICPCLSWITLIRPHSIITSNSPLRPVSVLTPLSSCITLKGARSLKFIDLLCLFRFQRSPTSVYPLEPVDQLLSLMTLYANGLRSLYAQVSQVDRPLLDSFSVSLRIHSFPTTGS